LFASIEAFDLSETRIRAATQKASELELPTRLRFSVASFEELRSFGGGFDAVIAENALHHSRVLADTINAVYESLKPGGLLIVRDFVGPSRFQWTDQQLRLTEEMLLRIPESNRLRWKSKTLKRRFFRPGVLGMLLSDPSEAAHSAEILPLLQDDFETIELKPVGGTLLQLVFDDIAHHFVGEDLETLEIVERCIEEEKELIESGQIPSDFVFGIFRRSK
jgi:SAM-dependent methyltransferase